MTPNTYIYLATEVPQFSAFFGFAPDYTDGSATNINGDDAILLYKNGTLIDIFGRAGAAALYRAIALE